MIGMGSFLGVLFNMFIMGAEFCFCLNCKSKSGGPVDWFVMYKVPKATREMQKKTTGKEFYYLDANNPTWSFMDVNVQEPDKNPLYYTLQQIYQEKSEEYGMYNDEPPQQAVPLTSSTNQNSGAHMKGAFAFDKDSGFWLILSVPFFPAPRVQNYNYGHSQLDKAQSILCISLDRKFKEDLDKIFDITKPTFFDGSKPLLKTVSAGLNNTSGSTTIIVDLKSKGGQPFREYAKSASFGADLYDSLVAPDLKDNLFVQTWFPNLGSNCSSYKVYDVKKVAFKDGYWFKTGIDHSKWAVTENKEWACIGDINRARSQFTRGGGTMCLRHAGVAKQFRNIVNEKHDCSKRRNMY